MNIHLFCMKRQIYKENKLVSSYISQFLYCDNDNILTLIKNDDRLFPELNKGEDEEINHKGEIENDNNNSI